MVTLGSRPVSLDTAYRAIVDATNGNTMLENVDASFGKTSIVASGGVYELEGTRGRRVSLTLQMQSGRLEDVLEQMERNVNSRLLAEVLLLDLPKV